MFSFFLKPGANIRWQDARGWTALHEGCRSGDEGVVRALLAAGADVEAVDQYEQVCGLTRSARPGLLVCSTRPASTTTCPLHLQTPLLIAAKNGRAGVAELLLAAGASVDRAEDRGHTALHLAAKCSHRSLTARLLAAGADKEAHAGPGAWTPLHYAAESGAVGPAEVLLDAGGQQ